MRLGLVVALVLCAAPAAAAPGPQPTPAQKEEIAKLEKELSGLQLKQATFAAAKVAKKLYELDKKIYGEDAIQTIRRKETLAQLAHQNGADVEAVKIYKELIAAQERLHGPQSREVFYALMMLDGVYMTTRDYDAAEAVVRRMLAIEKVLSGEQSAGYADQLSMLGMLFNLRNEYSSAQRAYEESLAIKEKVAKTPDDLALLGSVMALASLYWQTNQRAKAIPLFDREVAIASGPGGNLQLKATVLNGVASTYHYTGREDLAAPLRKRVNDMYLAEIARLEKDKPDDPQLPGMVGVLGFGYRQAEDWPNADKWLTRAVELDEKRSHFSGWASTLAEVKRAEGKPKEALALLETADAELHKLMPKGGGTYGPMIADVLVEMKDYKRAAAVLETYRAGIVQQFGKRHPTYGAAELTMAGIYMQAGDAAKAEPLLADGLDLAEEDLRLVLKTGTESDHAIYFAQNAYKLDTAINFELKHAPASVSAARLAMTTLLRRKGRVLDAAAASLATIRKRLSADDKQLLDELASARTQLAKLTVAGPAATGGDDYAKEVAALEDKIQKLEVQVGKKSAAYRVVSQPIDLAGVQRMIPRDARLVEIVNFQPYDGGFNPSPKARQERHYVAYVVGQASDPVAIDLGPEGAIDRAVEAFRKAVADPQNAKVMDLGHALYDLTMGKIAAKLGGSTNLLIAPDGTLNVVPFSALVDGNHDFLVKTYTFTYLTSGRDLLRLAAQPKAKGGGVIFADPSFDGDAKQGGKSRGARSADLASLMWPALPGTGQEADAVGKTMAGFKVFRGAQATEGNVKALHGPRILHMATHGFFLADEPAPASKAAGAPGAPPAVETYENPLLRSGLAFAGANKLESGDDDGILTALEASGLDLEGTRLVVLSACETGVGKVTNGEGVYGLRRALVIAGAESLVMSLWQVDDQATKDLMAGYYGHLKQGRGKSSALRDIQLEMQKQPAYAHPYYWASFLPAGDNAPL